MTEDKIRREYDTMSKIGEGTYGVVYKAVQKFNGRVVALKKIRMETQGEGIPSTAIREIALLKELDHPGVVCLHDVVISSREFLYLVFEFLDRDMKGYLEKVIGSKRHVPLAQLKSFTYQLLDALAYCHDRRVLHRDLKPQNLLLSAEGAVKIADFGLARVFAIPMRAYTHEVVTLWYRPPEILAGSRYYSPAVDIWSLGAILAEVATREALFQGDSEIDQLFKIFQVLGTPREIQWPGVTALVDIRRTFPHWQPKNLGDVLRRIADGRSPDADFVSLLKDILTYDVKNRIGARAALSHPFLADRPPNLLPLEPVQLG